MKSVAQTSDHFINIYCSPTVCQVQPGLTLSHETKRLPLPNLLAVIALMFWTPSLCQASTRYFPKQRFTLVTTPRGRNRCFRLRHGLSKTYLSPWGQKVSQDTVLNQGSLGPDCLDLRKVRPRADEWPPNRDAIACGILDPQAPPSWEAAWSQFLFLLGSVLGSCRSRQALCGLCVQSFLWFSLQWLPPLWDASSRGQTP